MCDASYVVKGCRPGATTARARGANGDVWSELSRSLDLATQLRGPSKVRAHQSLDEVAQGKLSFASYFGNALADTAAELAAQRHQPPPPVQQEAEKGYALAVLSCRRLAAIEACCWQADAARLVPALHFEPILPAPSAEVLFPQASKRVHEQGHRLYRFKSGFACHLCQRWRALGNSAAWAKIQCLPRTRSAGVPAEDFDGESSGSARAPEAAQPPGPLLRPDGEANDEFQRGIDEVIAYGEEKELGAQAYAEAFHETEEPLVSVATARRAQRRDTEARRRVAALARAAEASAVAQAASAGASDSHSAAVAGDALVEPESFPPWARLAHTSHG